MGEEVTSEDYKELFMCLRNIIDKIEHDPRLGWEGFEMKQQLREVARILLSIENALCALPQLNGQFL